MRLTFTFPDFTNPNHIPDWLMGWLVSKGMDYMFKNRKTIFRPRNFRKNYGWFKIVCHIISFIITATFDNMFTKLHLKPLEKVCERIIMYDFKAGLAIFHKIEPELATKIAEFVVRINDDFKIYKATGIKSEFLQKWFPNMTS